MVTRSDKQMTYKLYRRDYEGGYSLGGAESEPGTEWYVTDSSGEVRFWKRQNIDNEWWKHRGVKKFIAYAGQHSENPYHPYKFVRYIDDTEILLNGIKFNNSEGKSELLNEMQIQKVEEPIKSPVSALTFIEV